MAPKAEKKPAKKVAKSTSSAAAKKRKLAKAETYKIYIYKVLKQVRACWVWSKRCECQSCAQALQPAPLARCARAPCALWCLLCGCACARAAGPTLFPDMPWLCP